MLQELRIKSLFMIFAVFITFTSSCFAGLQGKYKVMVIDSYHRDYKWSEETNKGLLKGLESGGLLSVEERSTLESKDELIGEKIHFKRLWMDTKRKKSKEHTYAIVGNFADEIDKFHPDIIFLGDDNAVEHIGYAYLDYEVPIVFWGVNGNPDRYEFFDSLEKPGHNITGIYQSMFQVESAKLLNDLVPGLKTMAVVGDDSKTSRARVAQIKSAVMEEKWPLEIIEYYQSNDFEKWKEKVQSLSEKVDSFFILNVASLSDKDKNNVSSNDVIHWYTSNINKPEASANDVGMNQGLLCNVEDSGFNQGFEAGEMGVSILKSKKSPQNISVKTPEPGRYMINKKRAESLGIDSYEDKVDMVVVE